MKEKKELKGIAGLWYKKDGQVCKNPPRGPVDLNQLPTPPYHLVEPENYVQLYKNKRYTQYILYKKEDLRKDKFVMIVIKSIQII